VNPLRKLKLKSQLRNCDYALAGAVIKQQYYDANKSTVINQLIDDFMADPGFDTALKLIGYNDMMVFYFTESCAGGLYVRKNVQESTKDDSPSTSHSYLSRTEDSKEEQEAEWITKEKPKDSMSDRQRQILEESEAWMEQMIAREGRKPSPNSIPETVIPLSKESTAESEWLPIIEQVTDSTENEAAAAQEAFQSIAGKSATDNEPESVYESRSFYEPEPEYEPEPVFEPEPVYEPEYEPEPVYEPEPIYEPEQAFETKRSSKNQQAVPAPLAQPAPPEQAVPAKQLKSYPNVIATLKIDIHTMVKQLEEYRRELSYYPFNEKQLIAWIKSLEEAIEEFSEVVDILEDQNH